MRVAVLCENIPPDSPVDHLDTLVQRDYVLAALDGLGHAAEAVQFSLQLADARRELERMSPDVVFNLVEGVEGRGQCIYLATTLLDHLALPYTGSHTNAMFLTSEKVLAKSWMRAASIPTPRWVTRNEVDSGTDLAAPFILKPRWEDGSVGIDQNAVITAGESASLALHERRRALGQGCFAEEYVEGREFNLSMLARGREVQVLPPAEIQFEGFPEGMHRIVGYEAKWVPDSFQYQHTPRTFEHSASDRALLTRLNDLALACWKTFGLRGYARVDFRVDNTGTPWVMEVNANPCISPDSGFVAAVEHAGLDSRAMVQRILQAAFLETDH